MGTQTKRKESIKPSGLLSACTESKRYNKTEWHRAMHLKGQMKWMGSMFSANYETLEFRYSFFVLCPYGSGWISDHDETCFYDSADRSRCSNSGVYQ